MFKPKFARHRAALASLTTFSLAAGASALRFLPRWKPAANVADGVAGFFYGCAIALLIVSLAARRRPLPPADGPGSAMRG